MIVYKNAIGVVITEDDAIINGSYSKYFITNDSNTKIEIYSENKLLKVIFEFKDENFAPPLNSYKDVKISFNFLKWEQEIASFVESKSYFNSKLENISHLLLDAKKRLVACHNLDINSLQILLIEKYAYSKDSRLKYVFEYDNDGSLCIINNLEEGSNLYGNFDDFDWNDFEYYRDGQLLPLGLQISK